jgi:hypothetical protein
MARLIPPDFNPETLEMSERRVLASLREGLEDDWLLLPNVEVRTGWGGDAEIDLLAISPTRGVTAIEVKGGAIKIVAGEWERYGEPMPDPFKQVRRAKHGLIEHLKTAGIDLRRIWVEDAVALPDVASVPSTGLGSGAQRNQILTKYDLDAASESMSRIQPHPHPIPPDVVNAIVQAVRPTLDLDVSEEGHLRAISNRIDEATAARMRSVVTLDQNPRVLIDGGAGTGKTWLVAEWAKRAAERGERTAVVAFNRPMADRLSLQLKNVPVRVDTFHGLLTELLEEAGARIPKKPDDSWWRKGIVQAAKKKRKRIGTPFDTIILDEAQDLRPRWLKTLRSLLEPSDEAKLLMVLDPAQAIYRKGWRKPEEFSRLTLDVNLRNTREIAGVVQRLGGCEASPASPAGSDPQFIRIAGLKEMKKKVGRAIRELVEAGIPASQIAVLTAHTEARDFLIDNVEFGPRGGADALLTRWEDRHAASVLCETIHRTKGLEWPAVILATLDDPMDEKLLYVGASRARSRLVLIGPQSLGTLAGLTVDGEPHPQL